ncbi:MAG: hypothetical protein ABDH59_07420 [Fervidobacterium sp.]
MDQLKELIQGELITLSTGLRVLAENLGKLMDMYESRIRELERQLMEATKDDNA